MNWFEIVSLLSTFALVYLTFRLVHATEGLRDFTKALAVYTKALDDHAENLRQEEGIRRSLRLLTAIIKFGLPSKNNWPDACREYYELLNELLAHSKYIHDADTRRQLENMTSRVSSAIREKRNPFTADPNFEREVLDLRDRLYQESIYLHRDLGSYALPSETGSVLEPSSNAIPSAK